MMIESMAGKCASLNAEVYDATPFTFSEEDSAIEYFGKLLKQGITLTSQCIPEIVLHVLQLFRGWDREGKEDGQRGKEGGGRKRNERDRRGRREGRKEGRKEEDLAF